MEKILKIIHNRTSGAIWVPTRFVCKCIKRIEFNYREYVENPLSETEIRQVLNMMGQSAKEVLRKNDKVYKQLKLSGQENEEHLIRCMAEFPTLIQRPIGMKGNKAVLGRPVERLLEL